MFTWAIIGNRCLKPKIVGCLSMSTIGKRSVTIKVVCVHFNVSDNRESMFDAETNCFPDYAVLHVDESDNRENVCDEKNYSREYSRER